MISLTSGQSESSVIATIFQYLEQEVIFNDIVNLLVVHQVRRGWFPPCHQYAPFWYPPLFVDSRIAQVWQQILTSCNTLFRILISVDFHTLLTY